MCPNLCYSRKKFCVAAKIIETLLDPAFNESVDNSYTYDDLMKQNLANILYELLSDEVINCFANAYRHYDFKLMVKAINSIVFELKSQKEVQLAENISNSISNIDELLKIEMETGQHLPNKAMESLNIPVFISMTNMLENFARSIDSTIVLKHDKTKQLEKGYSQIFKTYQDANHGIIHLTSGTRLITGYSNLKELEFIDSEQSMWIQASDLLASAINKILKTIYFRHEMSTNLYDLGIMTFPMILIPDVKLATVISSGRTMGSIRDFLNNLAMISNCKTALNNA